MKRWDIMQGRDNGGKTYWNKVGVLFAGNDGKMWIELQALNVMPRWRHSSTSYLGASNS